MAKLNNVLMKIFGSNAGTDQIAQFGSLAAGSAVYTTNPATAQALSNWLTGWFGAVIDGNAPTIEDMNSAFFAICFQLALYQQAGIPEWHAEKTYYIGGFVSDGAGGIYASLVDDNLNNLVTDATKWRLIAGNVMNALGDMIYGGTSGALTKLTGRTEAKTFALEQTGTGIASAAPVWREVIFPTIQVLAASGTYTTPAGVKYIKVTAIGGGGGGSGTSNGGSGGVGGDTTFGTLITAKGGAAGLVGSVGAFGGVAGTINSPAVKLINAPGGGGGSSQTQASISTIVSSGCGGNSSLGGGAPSAFSGNVGNPGADTTGGGGSGGGTTTNATSTGSGGGSGNTIVALITAPAATYAFSVGDGGTAGAAGSGTFAGGVGGKGTIIVEEFYQ